MEHQVTQATPVEALIDRAKSYAETRIDLLKLKTIDKSSSFLSLLIAMLVVVLMGFIALMLLSVGLALLLGHWLGGSFYGFFIVALLYLVTGLVLYSSREKLLKSPFANAMIKNLMD